MVWPDRLSCGLVREFHLRWQIVDIETGWAALPAPTPINNDIAHLSLTIVCSSLIWSLGSSTRRLARLSTWRAPSFSFSSSGRSRHVWLLSGLLLLLISRSPLPPSLLITAPRVALVPFPDHHYCPRNEISVINHVISIPYTILITTWWLLFAMISHEKVLFSTWPYIYVCKVEKSWFLNSLIQKKKKTTTETINIS